MTWLLSLARRPPLFLWCVVVLLTPFYVLPSGLPQPGDLLVLPLIPAALIGWNGKLNKNFTKVLRSLALFVIWVCLVNYAWVIAIGNFAILKSYAIFPIYYVYNAAVVLVAFVLYQRYGDNLLRGTMYVTLAAVVFQVAASFFYRAGIYRGNLFFNSPNQLGFYALLAASIIAMLQRRLSFGLFRAAAGLTGCAYLAMLSGSRAAIGGIAILLFLLVFANPRVIIIASLAALGLITVGGPVADAISAVERRVSTDRNPKLSFAEERGYDRLWKHPEHLALGAGEGDVTRFQDQKHSPGELHSSFATVLFSYGIVGLVLFLIFLFRLGQGSSLRLLAMLLPTLSYTLAHNGLRTTQLWVLLAFFVILKLPAAATPKPASS